MPLENVDHKLAIDIQFKSFTENGILVYTQQGQYGFSDFVALAIVNG